MISTVEFVLTRRVLPIRRLRHQAWRPFLKDAPFVRNHITGMKRKPNESHTSSRATKRAKEPEPDYCDATPQKDVHEKAIWPASVDSVENARAFIQEW